MQIRNRTAGVWLLTAALVGIAFYAGAGLRSWQSAAALYDGDTARDYALLKLTPECTPVTPGDAVSGNAGTENRELLNSVFKLLKIHYVESITPERETEMARGAVRNMLDSLSDPDSRFLDPTERRLLDDAGAGKFQGIGGVLALKTETVDELKITRVTVVSPMPGSPAEAAGIKPGDSLTHIDGKWIISHDPFREARMEKLLKAARNKEIDELTYQEAYEATLKRLKDGISIAEALDMLSSKASGQISLKVERPGQSNPLDIKLTCKTTTVDPVVSKQMKNGIHYIRISQFSKRAAVEFGAELDKAKAAKASGIILDLRNNPGGLLDAATDSVKRISSGGIMAVIQEKSGKRTIRVPRAQALGIPMVVLVNGGTASVAELTAGTLRDHGIATLVGTKTFGDGLVQTPLILKDGSAAVLTTGKMFTSKGFDFEGKGIAPDKQVPQGRQGDAQLAEAEKILLAKLGKA